MRRDMKDLFMDLMNVKTKELEQCNEELSQEIHNPVIRKALMTYRSELLECLETYDFYLGKDIS